jgi:hypothetical protein
MRKAMFKYSIALFFAIFANAANHPFVGKHADASAVHHENGSISMRLGAKKSPYNKYKGLVSEENAFEPEKGLLNDMSEMLFGITTTDEEKMAKEYSERIGNKVVAHKKLGAANFAAILKNEGNYIFTGEIYMGKLTKMDVVFDTGSDWLVAEGANCTNC